MRCCTETEFVEDNHQHENKASCHPESTECQPSDTEREQQQMKIHSPEKADRQNQHEAEYQQLKPGEWQTSINATPSNGATIIDNTVSAVIRLRMKILKWLLEILEKN